MPNNELYDISTLHWIDAHPLEAERGVSFDHCPFCGLMYLPILHHECNVQSQNETEESA